MDLQVRFVASMCCASERHRTHVPEAAVNGGLGGANSSQRQLEAASQLPEANGGPAAGAGYAADTGSS